MVISNACQCFHRIQQFLHETIGGRTTSIRIRQLFHFKEANHRRFPVGVFRDELAITIKRAFRRVGRES